MHTHETHENIFVGLLDEVLLHGVLDTLKLIPFLFLTYLLMELIEHKASERVRGFMSRAGSLGPLVGGALGAVPQCGFSSVTANLYCAKIASLGTIVAVFLSTSDEMLPILISSSIPVGLTVFILLYKVAVGVAVGFIIDLVIRLCGKNDRDIHVHELCEEEGCDCEGGIVRSAIRHTLSITLFIFIITLFINALVFFIGEDSISHILPDIPVLSHVIAALFGLIPNCASSVALTQLFSKGALTLGEMLSGLFAGSGVGLLVLYRMNKKHIRENLIITAVLVITGVVFGLLADLIGIEALIL
ncbi:MAG: arsenic efflux protein [Clostridia bacterium]|nr:arsenic efflux protein [Clostridia bacterium]